MSSDSPQISLGSLTLLICTALFAASVAPARAAEVTLEFTGTVSVPSGNFIGVIAASDTLSGTLTYESTTAGAYTPSMNQFQRAEMLYAGAITSASVTVIGDTVSGSGGEIKILDSSDGMFMGDDSWEGVPLLSSGTIGGVTPLEILVNPNFPYTAFTLSPADPVPTPLDQSQGYFPQFTLRSVGGGTAYGLIDSYTVVGGGPPPVPGLQLWGLLALSGILGVAGRRALGRASR